MSKLIKRADGSYSQHGLWDSIRENKGSGNKPTKAMLIQETKIKSKKYEKGGLLAPNGKPSNLNPEQYKIVRTLEFKKWFGDWENDPQNASKVIDENGEPLVCYHGSPNLFNIFDVDKIGLVTDYGFFGRGFYFTAEKIEAKKLLNSKYVYTVFLNIKNPINQNDWLGYDESVSFTKKIKLEGFDGIFVNLPNVSINENKFIYDYWYIAFQPNQIKLADGTNTTFDENSYMVAFHFHTIKSFKPYTVNLCRTSTNKSY
jgi:hypothetical protein